MIEKLKSRKLLVTVLSAAGVAFLVNLGLDVEIAAKLVTALGGSYVLGQGIADAGAGKSQTAER